jgi:hypothetical protein
MFSLFGFSIQEFFICYLYCQKTTLYMNFSIPFCGNWWFSQGSILCEGMRFFEHVLNSPRNKNPKRNISYLLEMVVFCKDVITDVFGWKLPSGHHFRPNVRPRPHLPRRRGFTYGRVLPSADAVKIRLRGRKNTSAWTWGIRADARIPSLLSPLPPLPSPSPPFSLRSPIPCRHEK